MTFLKSIPCALALALVVHTGASAAAEKKPPETEDIGNLSLVVENDLFARTDQGYTSGVRASWVTSPSKTPQWAVGLAKSLPLFADWGEVRTEYAIQQAIFTPRDTRRVNPDPRDRPYAGWLNASFGLIGEAGPLLDQVALSFGVIGPASLAQQSQKFVHDVKNIDSPLGWDHQLKNEPTVQLLYQRSWRALAAYAFQSDYGIDFTPHAGFAAGNVYTFANAGATLRIGKDLRQDFGPPRIGPSVPGTGFFEPRANFGWYLFASLEGRAIARNAFLDGNTFVDSPSVHKLPFVADLQGGLVLTVDQLRISYTHVFRSREYTTQPRGDRFGAVSASIRW
jgi:lipid A 3-O-deacylase